MLEIILVQGLQNCCQDQDQAQNSGQCWSSLLSLLPTCSLGEEYTTKWMFLLLSQFTPIPTNWGSPQFQMMFCFGLGRSAFIVTGFMLSPESQELEARELHFPDSFASSVISSVIDFQFASEIHWHKLWKRGCGHHSLPEGAACDAMQTGFVVGS